MATPVGHALAAYGVWLASAPRAGRALFDIRGVLVCALVAIAPDLDFLPGILTGSPARYHQGVTHSIGVLVPVALLAAAACPWLAASFPRRALVLGLSYGSHMFLDLFGPDGRPPIGMPLLWPFTERTFLAPVTLLPGVRHAPETGTPTADWVGNVLSAGNLRAVGLEVAIVAPLVLAALWFRRGAR